ncbi:MAG: hypothetical protein SGJ20_21105 [Planctomycetota bacterium]|nr:hypothetical protein [Planctomycetota bacterium]
MPSSRSATEWRQLIDQAIQEPVPAIANQKITECHYQLSCALRDVLGEDSGANFHSWAVWGSRKAGVTIRQEDLDDARRDGTVVGGIVGALVGIGLGLLLGTFGGWLAPIGLSVSGAFCGALTGRWIISRSRRLSSQLILEGNRTVLADIGWQTALYVSLLHERSVASQTQFAVFLYQLYPGETAHGGQDLLREAFTQYELARCATTTSARHEAVYLGNCLAVLHEHIRLEPYIRRSMPWIIRRCVTKRLMQFDVGAVTLKVSQEVPRVDGLPIPASLDHLQNSRLTSLLKDPQLNDILAEVPDHAAKDWTQIRQRMRYIVQLFRALHCDPAVQMHPDQVHPDRNGSK